MIDPPAGLRAAPLATGDLAEVTRVWRACELHDDGEAMFTEEDFVGAWQRPSFDLERHTIGVRDGDALVGHAILHGEREVYVCVLPSHRGRGVGAWLMRWTQDAARAAGNTQTTQAITENEHAAMALLEAGGYERRWEGWMFEIEVDREPEPPRLPPGYAVRGFAPGRDDRAVHRVIEDAFAEWPDAEAEDQFDDWAAETLGRPGFSPEQIGVATHGEEVVGVAVLVDDESATWVGQLAVARAHRGRGLGRALLVYAFGTAYRTGRGRCELATDGRTGARTLYEHVGMRVKRSYAEYAKSLA